MITKFNIFKLNESITTDMKKSCYMIMIDG